jgi:cytochrome b6-f complex iron-sulfur subunit
MASFISFQLQETLLAASAIINDGMTEVGGERRRRHFRVMSAMGKPAGQREAGKKQKAPVTRRQFNKLTVGALSVAALGAATVTVNYLAPGLLFEPPPRFRAGAPGDYAVNSVTFFANEKVYLVRTAAGFFAESAICTHQQCITRWNPQDQLIECPCHGSRYQRDGEVVRGPAPRALPHFAVELLPEGKLLVDKTRTVKLGVVLKV